MDDRCVAGWGAVPRTLPRRGRLSRIASVDSQAVCIHTYIYIYISCVSVNSGLKRVSVGAARPSGVPGPIATLDVCSNRQSLVIEQTYDHLLDDMCVRSWPAFVRQPAHRSIDQSIYPCFSPSFPQCYHLRNRLGSALVESKTRNIGAC